MCEECEGGAASSDTHLYTPRSGIAEHLVPDGLDGCHLYWEEEAILLMAST